MPRVCYYTTPVPGNHLRSANSYVFLTLLFTELSKTGHWRRNSTQSFPLKTKKLAETIEQLQLVNMMQQGTRNRQTNLHISLQHRKLSSCSSSTSKRELHDASIAARCLRIKVPLLVKLEIPYSGHHGFSIGLIAHQILHNRKLLGGHQVAC